MTLIYSVKAKAAEYAQKRDEESLKVMVDEVCKLTGLRFRGRLLEQPGSQRVSEVQSMCEHLTDEEIGHQIISRNGMGSTETRTSLSQQYGDLLDMSIPPIMPVLCNIFMGRLSERFGLGEDLVASVQRARVDRQTIEIAAIRDDYLEFNVKGDDETRWYVPIKEVLLEGGGKSILMDAALVQMSVGLKGREVVQQQLIF
ncbi:hypothetical protein [Stenotrophomonas maltophilia]|uniref:hypothetical protein n=1 Tax=Stenotrophomonas maltophilia TaxID=40324 RepID=UPI0005197671|nr:hypothetical protein [Stenotrophomonas maltophilia]MCD5965579.1 hypothetical protein [Stenotrophomonas maltophilia]QGL75286.1 hypothetical protein FEO95_06445 [Stenotrophomonas maltophilia]